mgnify:CR=1 FL=1
MPGQCKDKKEDSNEKQMLQNFTVNYLVCTCLSKLCYCPSIYIQMFSKISLGGKLQNNICCELSNIFLHCSALEPSNKTVFPLWFAYDLP